MDFRKLAQQGPIAIQGGQDSYSEAAARRYFGDHVDIIYCNTFDDAFAAVNSRMAVGAFIPTENTLAGKVKPVYELLPVASAYPVAEEYMQITHCTHVYVEPGDKRSTQAILDDVTDIYSHPVALRQCGEWITRMNADRQKRGLKPFSVHEYEDTALAADKILRDKKPHQAAIASRSAGVNRGLCVAAEGIQDKPEVNGVLTDNYTRFAVFVPQMIIQEPEADKRYITTLFVSIPNKPGALGRILNIFGKHECDLDHLECMSKNHSTAEAIIELVGYHPSQPPLQNALNELRELGVVAGPIGVVPLNRGWMEQKITPGLRAAHNI